MDRQYLEDVNAELLLQKHLLRTKGYVVVDKKEVNDIDLSEYKGYSIHISKEPYSLKQDIDFYDELIAAVDKELSKYQPVAQEKKSSFEDKCIEINMKYKHPYFNPYNKELYTTPKKKSLKIKKEKSNIPPIVWVVAFFAMMMSLWAVYVGFMGIMK